MDSGGGLYPTLYYSPRGDLRLFYGVTGAVERMVVRMRPCANTSFGSEVAVYNGARNVGIHYDGGGTVDVAVANASLVVILQSTNNGSSWTFKKSYSGGNNTPSFPCYLPLRFTEDEGGLRLFYGYQSDSGIFGAHGEVYRAMRTNGTWGTETFVGDGDVAGACETGADICVCSSRGVFYSADNGTNYSVLGEGESIPGKLRASDMATGEGGRLYLLHSYSYGMAPTNENLTFAFSDDRGATWISPQTRIIARSAYMFHARFAVDGDRMFVVWQHSEVPNQHQYVQFTRSDDGGATWSEVSNIVSLAGSDVLDDASGSIDIASFGGRVSLLYGVKNGSNRLGVYLKELLTQSPAIRAVSATSNSFTIGFSDLVLSSTNWIQLSTDLSSALNWEAVDFLVPTGSVATWSTNITGTPGPAFYRALAVP